MPNLLTLKKLSQAIQTESQTHSILIYGYPKTGKTTLIGTAARIPEVNRIFFFDIDRGFETLLHMGLTDEELSKFTLYNLCDSNEDPIAIETMLRVFSTREGETVNICDEHGKIDCVACKKIGAPTQLFGLSMAGPNDLIVIDGGTRLGESAVAATVKGKGKDFKPGWDEYNLHGRWMSDILSVIQQSKKNFIMIAHAVVEKDEVTKSDTIFPAIGTSEFCKKVAGKFGTVIYTSTKLGKHAAGSSSTYQGNVLTGSRLNVKIENSKTGPDMRIVLIDGGIITPKKDMQKDMQKDVSPSVEVTPKATSSQPLSFAEKVAQAKEAPK